MSMGTAQNDKPDAAGSARQNFLHKNKAACTPHEDRGGGACLSTPQSTRKKGAQAKRQKAMLRFKASSIHLKRLHLDGRFMSFSTEVCGMLFFRGAERT